MDDRYDSSTLPLVEDNRNEVGFTLDGFTLDRNNRPSSAAEREL